MNTSDQDNSAETTSRVSIDPTFVRGIKGWLLSMLLTLLGVGVSFTASGIQILLDPRRHLMQLRPEILFIHIILLVALAFFPFYVALQLWRIRQYSLLVAKVFFCIFPFAVFTWSMFLGPSSFNVDTSVIFGFGVFGFMFSAPWLFYLHYSKRVRNTFLFSSPALPNRFECPFCLTELELGEEERLRKSIVCPECNNQISAKTVAA